MAAAWKKSGRLTILLPARGCMALKDGHVASGVTGSCSVDRCFRVLDALGNSGEAVRLSFEGTINGCPSVVKTTGASM
jgi:hypothetical protein